MILLPGLCGALMFTLALIAARPPAAAAASTVTVNFTGDVVQAGDGRCSLREATLYANGTAEPDCAAARASGTTTIVVPAGVYTLGGQPLGVTGSAVFSGAGAAATIVSGGDASQVFVIQAGATAAISDLTITRGLTGQACTNACGITDTVNGLAGGGVSNAGTLVLNRVIVTGNHTSPGNTNIHCTAVTGGCPGGNGGEGAGISNDGTLTIANSTITANSTGAGAAGTRGNSGSPSAPGSPGGNGGASGSGGGGGAVRNFQTLTITNSTIAGNATGGGAPGADAGPGTRNNVGGTGSAGGDGGFGAGIDNSGRLVIAGSTISGNETGAGGNGGTGGNGDNGATGGDGGPGGLGGEGGGIASTADMTISNSTIADNTAATSGTSGAGGLLFGRTPNPVAGANGGGIDQLAMGTTLAHVTVAFNRAAGIGGGVNGDGGTITAGNSIIASNQAAVGQNCDGVITDQGGNVEFAASSCPGGFLRADPKLATLADNGGPTQTLAPQAGSAAIHHVRTCVLSTDQRGVGRPVGSACDAGSYQVAPPSVGGVSATPTSTTTATVSASINPNLQDAKVVVVYGLTASYGASVPVSDLGAGNAAAPFSAAVGGLAPGTTYHFAVVATNADGQTTSSDGVFTTLPPLGASIAGAATSGATLSLTLACAGGSGPARCSGPIRVTAPAATSPIRTKKHRGKHPGRKADVVAAGAYSVASGSRVTVNIRLNRKGLELLGASYVLRATVSVQGTSSLARGVTFRYAVIKSLIDFTFNVAPDGSSSTLTQLTVIHVPRHGRVMVSCRGGGCPFAERAFAPRRGLVVAAPAFRHSRLGRGASVRIEVLAANQVGKVLTLVPRSGPSVSSVSLCLPPGAARPARCVHNHAHH